jgi:hypothetical protein
MTRRAGKNEPLDGDNRSCSQNSARFRKNTLGVRAYNYSIVGLHFGQVLGPQHGEEADGARASSVARAGNMVETPCRRRPVARARRLGFLRPPNLATEQRTR